MKKHLRYFENISDYKIAESGGGLVLPNVIYIKDQETVYYNPIPPVIPDYFKITALEDLEIGFEGLYFFANQVQSITVSLEYSLDGEKWNIWNFSNINVKKEENVYFRGENIKFSNYDPDWDDIYVNRFFSTGKFNVSGNILSLLYGKDFDNPVKSLPEDCFNCLFAGQTNLINAGELKLPSTTLGNFCYQCMFLDCYSLTTAPELPATILKSCCYSSMFEYCTSLTTPPALPATTLAEECYAYMFSSCTSLTTAPELPATTLAYGCYSSMFYGCTSLTTAPELLATTLADWCYSYMFQNCSSLNNIVMLATDISAYNCLTNWVYGVASTGTFTKHPYMTSLPNGVNGIPNGWTVQDAEI